MTTELSLPQRAAVALGTAEHEKQLMLLASEAKTITEIKNKDGREQCHSMMMTLKNTRVAIVNTAKAAREDATAFSKAVIAEEKRLIAITEAEETRLQGLRDAWDAAIEAERQAKIEAEGRRVAAIRERIESIRALPLRAVGKTSTEISEMIFGLSATPDYSQFEEFAEEYKSVRIEALDQLAKAETKQRGIEIEAEAQRQEAIRIKAEREELTRLRAEVEARRAEDERKAAAQQAEADRILKEKQDAFAAEMRAKEESLAAERATVARQQAVLEAAQAQREESDAIEDPDPMAKKEVMQTLGEKNRPAPTLKLGEINARIAPLSISADGLRQLGFEPAGRERAAVLYHESNWPEMRAAMIDHLRTEEQQQQAA